MMEALESLWVESYDPATERHLTYPEGSLLDEFERFTSEFADKIALDFFGAQTTYRELRSAVAYVAGNLYARGVRPGDHVALLMPTCPQHVVAFYAVLACGGIVVEHNPLYTTRELTPLFEDHRADVAIVWDAAAPKVQALPEEVRPTTIVSINMVDEFPLAKRLLLRLPLKKARETRAALTKRAPGTVSFSDLLEPRLAPPPEVRPKADDLALLLYTSGTTGIPKGVPLTHRNLVATATHSMEWVHYMKPGEEVFLACLPMFHIFGLSLSINVGLSIGALVHLLPKPEVGLILDAVKRTMPTMIIAVPPLFEKIATAAKEKGVSLQGVQTGISGAMPLQPHLIETWESLTGGLLIEGYGLSECSPILCGNPCNTTRKARSIGIPFPDTEVRLVDPEDPSREVELGEAGEIVAKGPQVFAGYRNNPEENERSFHEGWFRTGDVAVADEHGFLTIVDRIKEVVITGGFNVYPSEVEEAMRGHDGIADVAVVGLTNDQGNEEVVAAVVTGEGLLPSLEEIRLHAKERLAAYKVPRRIYVVPELPRNEMGKVLRREVRSQLDKRDLGEKLSLAAPDLKERLEALIPDLRERLESFGQDVQDTIDTVGPELQEKFDQTGIPEALENIDEAVRTRIGEASERLRDRFEKLDIAGRVEVLKESLFGAEEQPPVHHAPADEPVHAPADEPVAEDSGTPDAHPTPDDSGETTEPR